MASPLTLISKEPMTMADLEQVIAELKKDGPRGAAILGSTLAEAALKRLIVSKMVRLSATEEEGLFGPTAPLGSFSAQIRLAHAMGFISKKARHDLDLLRELRNAFAHAGKVIDFRTPTIANACTGFHCTKTPRSTKDARSRYESACRVLTVYLFQKLDPAAINPSDMPELTDLE